jgi:RNA polymerase sigma-B factor
MPHKLSERKRQILLERYAAHGRPADLAKLTESYLPLAHSLARRYHVGLGGQADIEQAACEGLVKALRRYDPFRGIPFTSFAVPTILGEVRRHLRDTSWPLHVPRAVQERSREVTRTLRSIEAQRGRMPSASEVASELGCSDEEVIDALFAQASLAPAALDGQDGDPEGLPLSARLGAFDDGFEHAERRMVLENALMQLPPGEQTIIRLRFAEEMTQSQIADQLHCSRSHAARLIDDCLDRLRDIVSTA